MELEYGLDRTLSQAGKITNILQGMQEMQLAQQREARQAQMAQYSQQVEEAKFTIGKLTETYNSSQSGAMREAVYTTMKHYYGVLPPLLRGAIEPYLLHSPMSPMEEKLREYDRLFPAPERPSPVSSYTINGKKVEAQMPPQEYAERSFNYIDHFAKRKHFATGIADEPTNILALDDGAYAVRKGPGSRPTLLSKEDINLRDASERLDIPVGKLAADGGWFKTDEHIATVINGVVYKQNKFNNLLTHQTKYVNDGFDKMPTPPEIPSKIQEAILDAYNEKPTTPGGKALHDILHEKKDLVAARQYLEQIGNGQFIFRVEKYETPGTGFFGSAFTNKNYRIIPIPVQKGIQPFVDASGKTHHLAVSIDDNVYDADGNPLGTVQSVRERFAQEAPKAAPSSTGPAQSAKQSSYATASTKVLDSRDLETIKTLAKQIEPIRDAGGILLNADTKAIEELAAYLASKPDANVNMILASLGLPKESPAAQLILSLVEERRKAADKKE